jgi:sodium/bile acid cotransporter 7
MKLKIDWFLVGMAAATALAWAFPAPGAAGGWLHPELLTKAGVALIFFLHGVTLPGSELRAGAARWRLHVVVQAATFLFFPLLAWLTIRLLGAQLSPALQLGIFFLGALPSTVSSSVAMTGVAGGNVAGAVFNATLSNLLGIFITPLWVLVVLRAGGQPLPVLPVVLDLVRWLLLPLALGQMCRPWLGGWAMRRKAFVKTADRGTILLLVYTSFCDSFANGVWTAQGGASIALVTVLAAGFFVAVFAAVSGAARALRFERGDRIAAVFCGSKKTLASGVPMAKLMFGANPALGVILLPIMIYHPLQLVICGFLAERWGREGKQSHPD